MGRLLRDFPRFPHTGSIYTMQEPTGFETEKEIAALKKVVWEGRCRKESNTSIRTFKGQEYVLKGDYRVQLGVLENGKEVGALVDGIKAGMFIEVTDRSDTFVLNVNDVYVGNLGTTLYCDEYKT